MVGLNSITPEQSITTRIFFLEIFTETAQRMKINFLDLTVTEEFIMYEFGVQMRCLANILI